MIVARHLLLAAILLTTVTSCKKNAVITLKVLTPPGVDTLEGVTELQLFVDDSKDGVRIPLTVAGRPDEWIQVEPDKQDHVLVLEAWKNEDLVARGRSVALSFRASDQGTQLVLWPIGRFAPTRGGVKEDWKSTRFLQIDDHRIISIDGQRVAKFDFQTSEFVDGPLLPVPQTNPSVVPLDDNALLIIGEAVTYRMGFSGESVASQAWTSSRPNGRDKDVVRMSDTIFLLVANPPDHAWLIDRTAVSGNKFDIEDNDRVGHRLLALDSDRLLMIGGAPSGGIPIRLLSLASKKLTDLTVEATIVPADLSESAAVILSDGKVLIGGGKSNNTPLKSLILLDPSCIDGNCSVATAIGELSVARFGHTVTAMADGRLLFAGGFDSNGQSLNSVEVFTYAEGKLTAAPPIELNRTRANHFAFLLKSGELLILGGEGRLDGELYQPK